MAQKTPSYTRSEAYKVAEFLRLSSMPIVLVDTNILLKEVRRVCEGKTSTFLQQLEAQSVRFVVPRHVIDEFFEEDKLQKLSTLSVSPAQMKQTFMERFATYLTVLKVDDSLLEQGLEIPDVDDRPFAALTEILEPDAAFSEDKHLSGLNTTGKTGDALFALRWGQNKICVAVAYSSGLGVTALTLEASHKAATDLMKRVPREVWLVGLLAAAAVLFHPTSRHWLVQQGKSLQTKIAPLWEEAKNLSAQMVEGTLVIEHNAQLAKPIRKSLKPKVIAPKTLVGKAVWVLARERYPLNLQDLCQKIASKDWTPQVMGRLAGALRQHSLARETEDGRWVLNGISAKDYVESNLKT
jgi:predicted nucleic acid-binding protein